MGLLKSRMRLSVLVTAFVLSWGSSAADAFLVTLTDDDRSVTSSGSVGSTTSSVSWSRGERPGTDYAPFLFTIDETRNAGANSASGKATLDSLATSSLLQGTGTATTSAVINQTGNSNDYDFRSRAESDSEATYRITFQVLQLTTFDLSAVLSIVAGQGCCGNSAQLYLRNTNSSSPTFNLSFGNSYSGPFSQNVALSGLLNPDTYILEAVARASADSYSVGLLAQSAASFDFALRLGPQTSVVPVPGSLWLLVTAVGAIAARRRFAKAD